MVAAEFVSELLAQIFLGPGAAGIPWKLERLDATLRALLRAFRAGLGRMAGGAGRAKRSAK